MVLMVALGRTMSYEMTESQASPCSAEKNEMPPRMCQYTIEVYESLEGTAGKIIAY